MRRYFICCCFWMILVMAGCSTSKLGSNYVPIKSIPEGQSLVFFYYPSNPNWKGPNPDFYISIGDQRLVKLERGGYYPYFANPGKVIFTSKSAFKYGVTGAVNASAAPEHQITLNLRSGHTYYIEGIVYTDFGFIRKHGLRLNQVSDEFKAQLVLEECRLLPKYVPPQ